MATPAPRTRRIPLGMAYAATQVNATVFRVSSLVSAGEFQYAVWYGPNGDLTVAQRRPGAAGSAAEKWETAVLPVKGSLKDAHNGAVIGVSGDGILHVSYNHHGNPLHYRRTARPHDIRSFGDEVPMTGKVEAQVTYPQFVPAPDGALYFFYRDGSSGNGSLCLNRYDPGRGWTALHRPLVDGQGQRNPYWWRPALGADDSLHVAWCWREEGDARTNHDIACIVSRDGGRTWETADGRRQPLPVNQDNAPVAEAIPMGSNLVNQCTAAVDADGHPHLAQYQNGQDGRPQYTHLWHDGKGWRKDVVSRRKGTFSLAGGGTLKIPISRPEIAIGKSGTVTLITRDAETGGNVRLYRSHGRDYAAWDAVDLPTGDLGEWEPTYDTERLRRTGVLSVFVLPVRQGDHETVTSMPPQEAYVLEMALE